MAQNSIIALMLRFSPASALYFHFLHALPLYKQSFTSSATLHFRYLQYVPFVSMD